MSVVARDEERFSETGVGPLSRWAAAVYWVLVLEVLIVATALPGLVPLVLLGGDASNAPLVPLCLIPLGPSLVAAIFAWRGFLGVDRDLRDLAPARHFWRGYRRSWLDVLRWWVPLMLVLAVLAVNVVHADAVSGGGSFALVSLVIGVALACWAGNALVLTALFALRTRDIARLSAYYLAARPAQGLGVLAVVVVAAGLAVLTSDWVTVLAASLLTLVLLRNTLPIVADVRDHFTVDR